MAKLRVDKIASVGVSTETTGSVFFDNSGDYLAIPIGTDFDLGTGDFTIETWWWREDTGTGNKLWTLGDSKTANGIQLYVGSGDLKVYHNNAARITATSLPSQQEWHHYALTRESGTIKLYVDGVQDANTYDGSSADLSGSSGTGAFFYIGVESYNGSFSYAGNKFISNFRICKGHAVYKSNFAPPTRELEVHQGPDDDRTVLLCCYDGENIFADKTGRHIISAYGDRVSSPTPTATDSPIGITTFQPGLTRDVDNTFGPTFQGGAGYASQNWLTLPKGTTTERFQDFGAVDAASARGVFGGGQTPTLKNEIDYITIATVGNAADFGDLTVARGNMIASFASQTRGLWGGGTTPTATNTIDYVTIAQTGNAADFGDLTSARSGMGGLSSSTRGLFCASSDPTTNLVDYVTIQSTGNALDFGDLNNTARYNQTCASPTRGIIAGGRTPTTLDVIDYVTIASTGNAQDFGDLQTASDLKSGCSNSTRGLLLSNASSNKQIDFITIATLGNSQTFGDRTADASTAYNSACASATRGVFGGGYTPTVINVIDFVTIATASNATNFGDLTVARLAGGACSNGHGGLG